MHWPISALSSRLLKKHENNRCFINNTITANKFKDEIRYLELLIDLVIINIKTISFIN